MQNEDTDGVHLPTVLRAWAQRQSNLPKRIRTRHKLIAATASVMEQCGYEGLTIEAIVKEAGVARGTFYLYFTDRSEAARIVMRAFAAMMRRYRPRGGGKLPAVQAIYRTNLFYIQSYALNSRLLAGRESLMRDCPQLVQSRDAINSHWARIILKDLYRRHGPTRTPADPLVQLAIRAVIAMADEFLREIYVYRSPSLVRLAQDPRQVAWALTQVWHRAIFGCDPDDWDITKGLPVSARTH
ncbi:MAG TPA: TetR/AcrR family transcriptional regulator, partial [Alcaligenes sp.]|nr:TetR/AcrR family transcriptional regulator [Alcaligenes sp.]HRL27832.1 TetR/AcrR family transcriptional regulator [Alcaligenes sp.]